MFCERSSVENLGIRSYTFLKATMSCAPLYSPQCAPRKLRLWNNSFYYLYAFNSASRGNTISPPCCLVNWIIHKYVCILNSYYATILFSTKCHYLTLSILSKSLNTAHSLILSNGNSKQQNTIFAFWNLRTNSNGNTNDKKYVLTALISLQLSSNKYSKEQLQKYGKKKSEFMAFSNTFAIYLQQLHLKKLSLNQVVALFL